MPGQLSLGEHSAEDRAVARSSPAPGTFYFDINDNILIQDIPLIFRISVKAKKSKATKPKTGKKPAKKRTKKPSNLADDGIIVIDDDLQIDAEKELEERK